MPCLVGVRRCSLTHTEFQATRRALGLTQAQLGEAIGLTGRMIRYYESGEKEIPKTVQLALTAYAAMPKSALDR